MRMLLNPRELMMGGGSTGGGGEYSRSGAPSAQIIYKIGIYGWRKRCLYVFLLLLMVTVIVNLALTVWILKVMDFNLHGMGKLRINDDKIRIESDAEFLKGLYAGQLKSSTRSPLHLESDRNITLNARDKEGKIINKLYLGSNKLETYAKKFQIKSRNGDTLFYADENEVYLGAEKLKVEGSGGATFRGSVQTPSIQSEAEDLRIESPTRGLQMSAPEGISILAPAGPIVVSSLSDLRLESLNRAIRLDGKTIELKNIQVSQPSSNGKSYPDVYQLCICKDSGKLFLALARGNCQATTDICS